MNDTFCSDIVALFWNHIWECSECFDKVFGALIFLFVFIGFLTSLTFLIGDVLFSLSNRLILRRNYKEKYDALAEEYITLNGLYEVLKLKYEETEK